MTCVIEWFWKVPKSLRHSLTSWCVLKPSGMFSCSEWFWKVPDASEAYSDTLKCSEAFMWLLSNSAKIFKGSVMFSDIFGCFEAFWEIMRHSLTFWSVLRHSHGILLVLQDFWKFWDVQWRFAVFWGVVKPLEVFSLDLSCCKRFLKILRHYHGFWVVLKGFWKFWSIRWRLMVFLRHSGAFLCVLSSSERFVKGLGVLWGSVVFWGIFRRFGVFWAVHRCSMKFWIFQRNS